VKKSFLLLAFAMVCLAPCLSFAADISDLTGTWSGNWQPKGGVIDAVTVEIRLDNGKLAGAFRTPARVDFSRAEFDSKTGAVRLESTDPKSNKLYKVDGKLNGLEIKGTLTAGDQVGDMLLIKWTYVPR